MGHAQKILVLGASGLIGRFVTDDLRARGFDVIGIARRFSASQKAGAFDLELPLLSMDSAALARLIGDHEIDLVVNCLGVLQDGPGSNTRDVHRDFVERLLRAIKASGRAIRLVQVSIPGAADQDRTAISATKREAERLIAVFGVPYAILRPGFVIAPSAYGGSAMLRALAALPIDLPAAERATPFQPVDVEDIAATIAWLAGRDLGDKSADAVTWDLMQQQPVTLGRVIEQFRHAFGTVEIAHRAAGLPARSRRQTWRSRKPVRLDAADPLYRDRRAAARRQRRSIGVDDGDRHRAEDAGAGGGTALRHHPGEMVRPAVPDQGAGDRKPGAVLGRLGFYCAGDFL
jgi:uncharacterized protein YbjT (DUF2867 family)